MTTHRTVLIGLLIIALSFVAGIYFYPQLPAVVASHWDTQGNVNGTMGKFWGTFLFPVLLAVLFVVFLIIPRLDPKHENIEKFRSHFNGFILFMMGLFFYMELLAIAYNIGMHFHIVRWLVPAFALFFYYIGVLLSHARRNWFIGIRTPWTLESEHVWNKTHVLGAKLFKVAALLALVGVFFPVVAFWFVVIPVVVFAMWSIIYSYVAFREEKGR